MKIAFVNCSYETYTPANSGAICTWIREVSLEAGLAGWDPVIISRSSTHCSYQGSNIHYIDYPGTGRNFVHTKLLNLQKRLCGWVRPRQLEYCRRVAAIVRQLQLGDGPIVFHNDMEMVTWFRRWFPRARIMHLAHNNNGTTNRFRRSFGRSIDVAMACSSYTARWNERFYGLKPGTVQNVYNGVNLTVFAPAPQLSDRTVISFSGRLNREKGPDLLLSAALLVSRKTRNFAIQIIGRPLYDREQDDQYVELLRKIAGILEQSGVECRFLGWIGRDQMPGALRSANVHVTPSRWEEPFGLATLEAMAAGMTVIGSRTGGTPEVIGDAGFLFEPEDVERLAQILERVIFDKELCRTYGIAARRRAEQFSWRETWAQIKMSATG